ncbi:MAG: methyl-accepting chemotaxis protein [Armatimonadetes bacterium]|nr:methyl-accepting chemotaxis protein [Armatimonadota bacterium]
MKLNIMGKLLLGFGVVLLLTLATSMFLIDQMKETNKAYGDLIDYRAVAYANAEATLARYNAAAAYLRGYVISGDSSYVDKYQKTVSEGDDYLKKVFPALQTAEGKQMYEDFQKKSNELKKYAEQLIPLVQARESASGPERVAAEERLVAYYNSNMGVVGDLVEAGTALAERQEERMQTGQDQVSAQVGRAMSLSVIFVAVVLALGLVIAFFIARMIAAPIRQVDAGAAKIATGDLTGEELRIKTKDEAGRLAQSFNTMVASLKEMVGQLQEKSQIVASSAAELSASAENVSAGASETSSSIGEVASTVEQVTANTQRIAEASTQAAGHAREGKEGIQNIVGQMEAIQRAAEENGKVIQELNEAAAKISQIVELISHIADQTNLLALNAAIEAARAGEHGRGFAVVAEEVRKLAEQSAGAAKEIYALINTIQQESKRAVQSMEQSALQVEAGAQVVQSVGVTFEKIITFVQGLAGEIQEVAAAAEEMSSAVENVAAASEEQTATMEEVSATAQNLARLAGELDALAAKFRIK